MCGRYSLAPWESREIMDILRQVQGDFKTGEIFPADPVPVLMEAGEELADFCRRAKAASAAQTELITAGPWAEEATFTGMFSTSA